MAIWKDFYVDSLNRITNFQTSRFLSPALNKKIYFYMGYWPGDNEPKRFLAIFRRSLPYFLLTMSTYSGLVGKPCLAYFTMSDNLQSTLDSVASTFAEMPLFATYVCLLFRRKQIARMFVALEAMNTWGTELSQRPTDILKRNGRWSKRPYAYLFGCVVGLTLSLMEVSDRYKKREFFYEQWYPFDKKASPAFEIVFALTLVTHYCSVISIVSFIVMFMSLIAEAIGNLRLLSHNLRHIVNGKRDAAPLSLKSDACVAKQSADKHTRKIVVTSECDTEDGEEGEHLEQEEDAYEALKTCVQYHYSILRFIEELTCTYSEFLFIMLICALVPTSLGVVILIYAEEMDTKVMSYFFLIVGSNFAAAMCCWLASVLTDESEAVRDAVYDCNWFDQSESFKRSMRIIMSHGNQPVVVKVCGFVNLSMETFYAMSQMAYTYSMTAWTQYNKIVLLRTEVVQQLEME